MASALQRASAIMASGTMVSRILGFVKTALLAVAIGQFSRSFDAFANGNVLPNTLYMLLAGGMLNAILVPQIVKSVQHPDGGRAYLNKVLTLVSVALFAVTALAMVAAPLIMQLLTPTWGAPQRALAVAFAYWCIPQIMFYGWYTVLGEALNAKKIFGPFTWAPAIANIVAIAGILAYIGIFGSDNYPPVEGWTPWSIALLGGSATLGIAAQAIILIVPWRKAGLGFRPDFRWRGVGLKQTGKTAFWALSAATVMTIGGLVATPIMNMASGEGPATGAMQNIWLVFMLPHSVIAVSLVTAYFTRLSELGQVGDIPGFRIEFLQAAKQVTMLMIFAAALMFMAAPFVARVMWATGTPEDIAVFAEVIRVYSIGLAAYSLMFTTQRAFFALSDARTPFFFITAQLIALIAGLLVAVAFVDAAKIGVTYAAIWTASTVGQSLLALWLLRRKLGAFGGRDLAVSVGRYLIAAVPALVAGYALSNYSAILAPEFGIVLAVVFALAISAVMGVIYLLMLLLLRVPEVQALLRRFTRR